MKTITLISALLFSTQILAFGPIGHRVVARIAEQQLKPQTLKKIEKILGGETLPMVSTWADEIRSDPKFKQTSSWHYINIESGKKIKKDNIEGGALDTLEGQLAILRNVKSKITDQAMAIKWLTHLVGDLHQPLHAGLASDRGGNRIELTWFGTQTNLHEIWDSTLIDSRKLSYSEQAEFLMRKMTPELKSSAADSPTKWIEEDIALRELVYSYPKSSSKKWEYDYIFKTKTILDQQLIKAGLRLAHLLEDALKVSGKK